MKRLAFVLAAIIGISMFVASPAQAGTGTIRVTNTTSRSVWITAYASCGWTCAWHIIGGGAGAFCLRAGESRYMDHWKRSPMAEVKLRAEVKHRADCAGPNLSDTYDTHISANDHPDDLVANVHETANDRFYIKVVGH